MDLSEIYKEFIPENIEKETKRLYDLAYKSRSFKTKKSEALPELIIDGFDTEQIWQQIELANKEVFSEENLENIAKLLANKEPLVFPFETNSNKEAGREEDEEEEEEEEEEKTEYLDDKKSDEDVQSSDDDTNENDKRTAKKISGTKRKKRRTTEVDDKFFKLDELDEYLKIEDKKEMKAKNKVQDDSSDEDEEHIDLFYDYSDQDDDDDDEDDDQDSNEIQNGKSMKYADFFDSPESDAEEQQEDKDTGNEENDMDDDEENEHAFNDENNGDDINEYQMDHNSDKKKKVKFNLLDNSDDSDSIGKNVEDPPVKDEIKSSLEARQERLQKKIAQLEKEVVSEKPWQLKGETNVFNRPKDSLLEEYVEFDTGSRPAPIMTEKTTMKLEDIIRSRIKDKAWDDVEKKVKPVETPLEFKKKLVMNQEKSKESLAQIYENEYIKQREALTGEDKDEEDKEEPPEHIEIKERMHTLFRKLDALSNFHYTPKPAKPEIKIISNVPAVNMEEVAPVTTSDATLLAPEEVKSKPKGDVIGKSERTKTDKKRERRKKKLKQHVHAINLIKNPKDNNKNKKSKDTATKVTGRNVIKDQSNADKKAIKSSTAFFAQLQDEVKSGILSKTKELISKKKKDTKSAVRLKL